ncbi:MAG TPA: oligopeptide transporter, OPT family [Planctomycetota bacterium]|nr:oligopeptide transporter, OPT family [Planctomycetota bacterium]
MPHAPGPAPEGPAFRPFVPPEAEPRELTWSALAVGSILGIVFAASSVYLALKVGLTVSASIPIAVLSITLFRRFARGPGTSILVNNIVQTTGSAGESLAAGVAFTLPSLLVMGYDLEFSRVLLVALLGGVLGVLMMVPLRHGLIVKEHGRLTYPEGTACAQVLVAGERGGMSAKTVFGGFGVGAVHALLYRVFGFFKEIPEFVVPKSWGHFAKASVGGELSAPLLGVGYLIGYRTAAEMMAGGVVSFLVLVPLIAWFGEGIPGPFGPDVGAPIGAMEPYEIRNAYLLYIGAGAVATGGFLSLARSMPMIVSAFRRGLGSMGGGGAPRVLRTERDLPMRVVIFGSLALAAAIALAPVLQVNAFSAVLIVAFGFFFVTVSSRVTGELGSSSNPISGMTVATLLLTCLLFVAAGWTGVSYKAMALTTAALVCVAASNGGTISQDLKTGFLVGATPARQQIAIVVGVITSAAFIGGTLAILERAGTTVAPKSRTHADVIMLEGPLWDGALRRHEGVDYRVAEAAEWLASGEPFRATSKDAERPSTPPRRHLVDASGVVRFKVVETATPLARSEVWRHEGADYRVVNLPELDAAVPRGRYLADEAGKIRFKLDPSVGGEKYAVVAPAQRPDPSTLSAVKDEVDYEVDGVRHPIRTDLSDGRRYLLTPDGASVAYEAATVQKFDAPKARLFALIIDGILDGRLPWTLVLVGVFLALALELIGVSSLSFAVGAYLPIDASTPIFLGGIVRAFVDRRTGQTGAEAESSPGTLHASGLIAGGAIATLLALGLSLAPSMAPTLKAAASVGPGIFGEAAASDWLPLLPFGAMMFLLARIALRPTGAR